MESANVNNPTIFNPMQLHLLKMFSYVRTEEQLIEIRKALSEYFFHKVEVGMEMLCESGEWDEAKEDSIRKEHPHAPYVYK